MFHLCVLLFVYQLDAWKTYGGYDFNPIYSPTNIPKWNYMKTVPFRPQNWEFPTSVAEIQAIVNKVRLQGGRIKVVGAGHSWVGSAGSTHTMISLDQMPNGTITQETIGGVTCMTAMAGIRIIDFLENIWARGYTLSSMGWSKSFTLAGVINGGTHGSNKAYGIMADSVKRFKLVLADGSLITASRTQNADLFFSKVSMGTMGIMYEVSMEVVPIFDVLLTNIWRDQNQFSGANMPPAVTTYPYVEWWWYPGNTGTQYWQQIIRVPVVPGVNITGAATTCLVLEGYNGPTDVGCVDRSYVAMTEEEPYLYWEAESFIPADRAAEAVDEWNSYLDSVLASYNKTSAAYLRRAASHWCGARFINASQDYLAPNYGRDTLVMSYGFYDYCYYENTASQPGFCNASILSPNGPFDPIIDSYYDDWPFFEERFRDFHRIFSKYEARPHWGKLHSFNANDLKPLYPQWDKFQATRLKYDPNGLFMNSWTDQLFNFQPSKSAGHVIAPFNIVMMVLVVVAMMLN